MWSPAIRRGPTRRWRSCIAAAQAKPRIISYASVGSGSIGHLAMVLLGKQAGVELVHVPYRGGAPAMNDVIAGHIDLINGSAALITPQVAAGTIRPLFQMGPSRLPALPTCRPSAEGGYPGAAGDAPGGRSTRRRARRSRSSSASAPRSWKACARSARHGSSPRPSR